MLLPWYRLSSGVGPFEITANEGGFSETYRSWETGLLWVGLPLALSIAIAVAVRRDVGHADPGGSVPWRHLLVLACVVDAYLILVRFFAHWAPQGLSAADLERTDTSSSRGVGLYLAVIGVGLVVAGAVQHLRAPADRS
jgi:hypothetical protein